MANRLRIGYEGAIYHVAGRGSERGKIFFLKVVNLSDADQGLAVKYSLSKAKPRFFTVCPRI